LQCSSGTAAAVAAAKLLPTLFLLLTVAPACTVMELTVRELAGRVQPWRSTVLPAATTTSLVGPAVGKAAAQGVALLSSCHNQEDM
jgi:hypothetical protein